MAYMHRGWAACSLALLGCNSASPRAGAAADAAPMEAAMPVTGGMDSGADRPTGSGGGPGGAPGDGGAIADASRAAETSDGTQTNGSNRVLIYAVTTASATIRSLPPPRRCPRQWPRLG